MDVLRTLTEVMAALDPLWRPGRRVGLVPTMGFLHAGHASLMDRAAAECDIALATVFVNPLQFGAGEDLEAYPRDLEGDADLAATHGVDLLFAPSVAEMYGAVPPSTAVTVGDLGDRLEGATRPGHFDGVATVVAKLFNIVGPCRAYFGEKDFQQLVVIRRMARDLSFPVEVVGCPTVRELDGLALSSRNAYLSDDERAAAPVLHRALRAGAAAVMAGERDPAAVEELIGGIVSAEPLVVLDYAAALDAERLEPIEPLAGAVRLLVAARFPSARLIDNVGLLAE